jgi:hypothetical protein
MGGSGDISGNKTFQGMIKVTRSMICTDEGARQRTLFPARRRATNPALRIQICPGYSLPFCSSQARCQPEPIRVRYPEGRTQRFFGAPHSGGKAFATGDLTEVLHGNEVVAHLVFHFKDGSVDDDTTVFSQLRTFRLISDHHIQKGPSFPHPTNVLINAATGQVTVHYQDKDREKVETDHLDLPPDLANGILLNS